VKKKTVYVTQPSLPPLEEYIPYLKQIWESKHVTNNGPFHQKFEAELCHFLGGKYCNLFCNGTLALILALKALEITGEVITTPFTFVATSNAIKWVGAEPVFCDITESDYNIDVAKIEELISPKTTAILAVHVYGNPCDVYEIERIAKKHNLRVIYDAAHAFNVKINNEPVTNFGDLSILSFHGTKLFHTFEGGATITNSSELKDKIDKLKNFGFQSEESVFEVGINAKMNELQASMGLLNLDYVESEIKRRKEIVHTYMQELSDIEGITCNKYKDNVDYSYAYFPIMLDEDKFGLSRNALYENLKKESIYSRKYFYPLLTDFHPYLKSVRNKTIGKSIHLSNNILCLPLFKELAKDEIIRICKAVRDIQQASML
jgi:dTDP-4-amino-4,6-dideoxygalactose transaminase